MASTRGRLLVAVVLTSLLGGVAHADDISDMARKAEAAVKAGKLDEAEALYRKLVDQGGDAYTAKLAAVQHTRWVVQGDEAAKADKLEDALRCYRRALQITQSVETERKQFAVEMRLKARTLRTDHDRRAKDLEARGDAAMKSGDYEGAVGLYRQVLQLSRGSAVREKLADAQVKLVDKLERQDARQWLDRARQMFTKQEWAKAAEAFARAAPGIELTAEDRRMRAAATQRRAAVRMVLIPAGSVWLGSATRPDEQPRHLVRLPAFYIDRHEVTNEEYYGFVSESGHRPPATWGGNSPPGSRARFPVLGVSAIDAQAYAKWAGKRLPTEAEWVRAARGESRLMYPWGEFWAKGKCNALEHNAGGVTPVGSLPEGASPFGLHDMLGNAMEWTSSVYRPYPGASWEGPKASHQVLRGGAWYFPGKTRLRIGVRYHAHPLVAHGSYGFRCAMDAKPTRK